MDGYVDQAPCRPTTAVLTAHLLILTGGVFAFVTGRSRALTLNHRGTAAQLTPGSSRRHGAAGLSKQRHRARWEERRPKERTLSALTHSPTGELSKSVVAQTLRVLAIRPRVSPTTSEIAPG